MADSVEQAVYNLLTADSDFMANFEGLYWQESETTTYPFITFWLVDDNGQSTILNAVQGIARIQFDLWDDNKIRSARLRTVVGNKVRGINDTQDGYYLFAENITEATIQRASGSEPYHAVVDGIIRWHL